MTRGSANNLFQVATLVRAATAMDAVVDVLFCDAALTALRRDRVNDTAWSEIYDVVLPALAERLLDAEFVAMEDFLRDSKEHGDAVRYLACSETIAAQGLTMAALTSLLDAERPLADFLADADGADALLRF